MPVPTTSSTDDSSHRPWQGFAVRVAVIGIEACILAGLFGGTLRALRNDLEDATGFNRWRVVGLALAAILVFHARRHLPAYRSSLSSPRRLAANGPVDVAHVHCAGSMRVLDVMPAVPVVCHLHELSVGLDLHLRPRAAQLLPTADRYVAVSDAVRREFLERFSVDPGSVQALAAALSAE